MNSITLQCPVCRKECDMFQSAEGFWRIQCPNKFRPHADALTMIPNSFPKPTADYIVKVGLICMPNKFHTNPMIVVTHMFQRPIEHIDIQIKFDKDKDQ